MRDWLKQSQKGFIPLFLLIPFIIVATIIATLSVSKIIEKSNKVANISQQIEQQTEQKESELDKTTDPKTPEPLVQEIAELKKQVESLRSPPKVKEQIVSLPPQTIPTPTISSDLKIELYASRYSLPANGEAISFITAEVKDKNGKVVESFKGEIEFNTTAGVLIPNKTTAKNGSAYVELQASTVPANLTITAQSGSVKSNSINLSFTVVATSAPNQSTKLPITSGDLEAVVALGCPSILYGIGSGVIISSDGFIMTNHHVVQNNPCDVYISNSFNTVATRRYKAGFIESNSTLDIAILKITYDANGNSIQGTTFPYFSKGYFSEDRVGQEIRLLGYPDFGGSSSKPTLTQGIISGEEKPFVKTDVKSSAGSSGGAVLDNSKNLIGIWKGILIGRDENIGYFVNIEEIRKWRNY